MKVFQGIMFINFDPLDQKNNTMFPRWRMKKNSHPGGCKNYFALSMCIQHKTEFHFGNLFDDQSAFINWILSWIPQANLELKQTSMVKLFGETGA